MKVLHEALKLNNAVELNVVLFIIYLHSSGRARLKRTFPSDMTGELHALGITNGVGGTFPYLLKFRVIDCNIQSFWGVSRTRTASR